MIKINGNNEVCWEWVCKKYSSKECENKSTGYYVIKEEGNDRIMAFRRPIDLDENYLPEGVVRLKNVELMADLDKKVMESSGVYVPQQEQTSELDEEVISVFG